MTLCLSTALFDGSTLLYWRALFADLATQPGVAVLASATTDKLPFRPTATDWLVSTEHEAPRNYPVGDGAPRLALAVQDIGPRLTSRQVGFIMARNPALVILPYLPPEWDASIGGAALEFLRQRFLFVPPVLGKVPSGTGRDTICYCHDSRDLADFDSEPTDRMRVALDAIRTLPGYCTVDLATADEPTLSNAIAQAGSIISLLRSPQTRTHVSMIAQSAGKKLFQQPNQLGGWQRSAEIPGNRGSAAANLRTQLVPPPVPTPSRGRTAPKVRDTSAAMLQFFEHFSDLSPPFLDTQPELAWLGALRPNHPLTFVGRGPVGHLGHAELSTLRRTCGLNPALFLSLLGSATCPEPGAVPEEAIAELADRILEQPVGTITRHSLAVLANLFPPLPSLLIARARRSPSLQPEVLGSLASALLHWYQAARWTGREVSEPDFAALSAAMVPETSPTSILPVILECAIHGPDRGAVACARAVEANWRAPLRDVLLALGRASTLSARRGPNIALPPLQFWSVLHGAARTHIRHHLRSLAAASTVEKTWEPIFRHYADCFEHLAFDPSIRRELVEDITLVRDLLPCLKTTEPSIPDRLRAARFCLYAEKLEEAHSQLSAAVAIQPALSSTCAFTWAHWLCYAGESVRAEAERRTIAAAADTSDPETAFLLASLSVLLGDLEIGLTHLHALASAHPEVLAARAATPSGLQLARILSTAAGDPPLAEHFFQRLMEVDCRYVGHEFSIRQTLNAVHSSGLPAPLSPELIRILLDGHAPAPTAAKSQLP